MVCLIEETHHVGMRDLAAFRFARGARRVNHVGQIFWLDVFWLYTGCATFASTPSVTSSKNNTVA